MNPIASSFSPFPTQVLSQGMPAFYPNSPSSAASNPAASNKVYNIPQYSIQQDLPVGDRHGFSPNEQQFIEHELNTWYPKIAAGFATPIPQLLANPLKYAGIHGAIAAIGGALLGAAAIKDNRFLGGLAGAVVTGLITGVVSLFSRRQTNEDLLDLMSRLPEGATKRDLLSDSAFKEQRARQAMRANSLSNALLAGAIIGSDRNRY